MCTYTIHNYSSLLCWRFGSATSPAGRKLLKLPRNSIANHCHNRHRLATSCSVNPHCRTSSQTRCFSSSGGLQRGDLRSSVAPQSVATCDPRWSFRARALSGDTEYSTRGFQLARSEQNISQAVINRRLESHDSKKSKDFAVAANC